MNCLILVGLLMLERHHESEYIAALSKMYAYDRPVMSEDGTITIQNLPAPTEVDMPNGTRADLMIPGYACEVEFSQKWPESVGQSLNYAEQSAMMGETREPMVILILRTPDDLRFLRRLLPVARRANVKVVPYFATEIIPTESTP